MRGCGCKSCGSEISVSKLEKKWLDSLSVENENRQYKISKYIVDGYVPKEKRDIEIFNGRPSVIPFDKIASFDGAADIGYFFTHMTEDEKEDIKKLQKEIFI